jgi:anti-anti-sigma factor
MAVKTQSVNGGKTIKIEITERFDFNIHKELKNAYKDAEKNLNFVVDLEGASYMDSSALGMLLQLREHAGGVKSSVTISNADKNIKEILRIANFYKLMTVE